MPSKQKEYTSEPLSSKDLAESPFDQFSLWFNKAAEHVPEPNAMALATASADAKPTVRMVLLKDFSTEGFVFYSDFRSEKGQQLRENPHAELLFFWDSLHRQIRIRGSIQEVESGTYFAKRPRGSQIATVISHQGQPIASREELEKKFRKYEETTEGSVPCPSHWQGYRLIPQRFEFWQGRQNRLHDRFQYLFKKEQWIINRLQP